MTLPGFADLHRAGSLYLERVGEVSAAAQACPALPAREDQERVAVFAIDCQVSFCLPGASLYVPGAEADLARALAWLYRNIGRVTTLFLSMDEHHVHQIFHPAWWRDPAGRPPPPFTPITAADVEAGRWIPAREPAASLDYVRRLDATGRYTLTIWPYHCLLGGLGSALMPALMEYALFHALVRDQAPRLVTKGSHPLTESYSVLSPEVQTVAGTEVGRFDDALFEALLAHDRVYVFGEASSHCVRATLEDLAARIQATCPEKMGHIWILADAMSPVPPPPLDPLPDALNFPALAEAALASLVAAGMRVVRTTDPWEPG